MRGPFHQALAAAIVILFSSLSSNSLLADEKPPLPSIRIPYSPNVPPAVLRHIPRGAKTRFYGSIPYQGGRLVVHLYQYDGNDQTTKKDSNNRDLNRCTMNLWRQGKTKRYSLLQAYRCRVLFPDLKQNERADFDWLDLSLTWVDPQTRRIPMLQLNAVLKAFFGTSSANIALVFPHGFANPPIVKLDSSGCLSEVDAAFESTSYGPLDEHGFLMVQHRVSERTRVVVFYDVWNGHGFGPWAEKVNVFGLPDGPLRDAIIDIVEHPHAAPSPAQQEALDKLLTLVKSAIMRRDRHWRPDEQATTVGPWGLPAIVAMLDDKDPVACAIAANTLAVMDKERARVLVQLLFYNETQFPVLNGGTPSTVAQYGINVLRQLNIDQEVTDGDAHDEMAGTWKRADGKVITIIVQGDEFAIAEGPAPPPTIHSNYYGYLLDNHTLHFRNIQRRWWDDWNTEVTFGKNIMHWKIPHGKTGALSSYLGDYTRQ